MFALTGDSICRDGPPPVSNIEHKFLCAIFGLLLFVNQLSQKEQMNHILQSFINATSVPEKPVEN